RLYVNTLPAAIQGQEGNKATYKVACRLVLGFDLGLADALTILEEYSARCVPPWTRPELDRMLQSAARLPGPPGQLRGRPPRQSPDWDLDGVALDFSAGPAAGDAAAVEAAPAGTRKTQAEKAREQQLAAAERGFPDPTPEERAEREAERAREAAEK